MILIIALAAILLLGAGGGFYYWRSLATVEAEENGGKEEKSAKKSKAKKNLDEEADEASEETAKTEKGDGAKKANTLKDSLPEDSDVKHIIELQPFIVNLADAEDARYLRLSVSLGIGESKEGEKPNPLFTTRVRNAMLAVLADKKSDEVLSAEGKIKLRKELLKAAQAVSEEPEVYAIYITDFIVQL